MFSELFIPSLARPASVQRLGDSAVVLMTDSGQLYTGNETVEAMLSHVDGQRTLGEIVDLLAAEFDVERPELAADILSLAGELASEGIIEGAAGAP